MQYETIISKYEVMGRKFCIVKTEDGFYLAVDYKYIDSEGNTTKALSGLELCASRNLRKCLKLVRDHVKIEYLLDNGATKAEAFSAVTGVPLEVAELIF